MTTIRVALYVAWMRLLTWLSTLTRAARIALILVVVAFALVGVRTVAVDIDEALRLPLP